MVASSVARSVARPIASAVVNGIVSGPLNLLVNPTLAGAASGTPGIGPTSWIRTLDGTIATTVTGAMIEAAATAGRFILEQVISLEIGTYDFELDVEYVAGTAVLLTDLLWTGSSGTKTYFVDDVESLASITGASTVRINIIVASPHTPSFYIGVGIQGAATRTYKMTNPSLRKVA